MNHPERLVVAFHSLEAQHVDVAGGKGAGLARASRKLPVPPGVIVTSQAYREFVRPVRRAIDAVLARHAGDAAAISRAVRHLLDGQAFPQALLVELQGALRDESLLGHSLAVRSSGTQEDSSVAAFAGMHDTFLNCHGMDSVAQALRGCYRSMWSEHALAYRKRMGVDHLEAAMAVVVQRLVRVAANEPAGVAFSVDPVRGRLDTVLINGAFGLGESVVGGEAAIDEFRVSRQRGAAGLFPVIEQTIADKRHAHVAGRQGVERVEIDQARAQLPVLDPVACSEVAELALAAEECFGFPQDIEWAREDGRFVLLQSRPVTRIPPRWTRDESAERFPNAVTPMTWDLVEQAFHASLNHSLRLMGLPSFEGKWFGLHDGYVYGNQNAVELYQGRLPIEALGDMQALIASAPELMRRHAWVAELPLKWRRDLDAYLQGIDGLMHEPLASYTVAELWDYVLRVRDLGCRYFLPNIAISLTQRSLHVLLVRMVGMITRVDAAEAASMAERLLAVTDTMTGRINQEMRELARVASRLPGGAAALAQVELDDGWPRLDAWPEFSGLFRDFVERHGHREFDFDAYHPTWIEAPRIVLEQIIGLAGPAGTETDQGERISRARADMASVEQQLLAATPGELRALMQDVMALARSYTALDDLEHYQTTRLSLPFRRGLRELGNRLLGDGVLARSDDIYFCPVEIFEASVASGDFAPVTQAVARCRASYERALARTPDWELGVANCVDPDARTLHGLGGSAGTAEASVYLVRGPGDFADFPAGSILVARTTGPAWTPLFYRCAGVVTESGGPLSHGAVTAREIGIPAVMSVRHAMHTLATGDRVRIDGTRGLVQWCDRPQRATAQASQPRRLPGAAAR